MVAGRAAVVVVLIACSGKPKPDDAHGVTGAEAGAVGSGSEVGSAGNGAAGSGSAGGRPGDLQVRVEWVDVPVVARSSPGRTVCGTPRTPSVAPTTTWGVPDALVIVDGGAAPAAPAHVTLADCIPAPKLVVGAPLDVTSAVDQPAKLVLRKRGTAADLAHITEGSAIAVALPIAGHTARAALDPGAVYSLDAPGDANPEVAWIATASGAYVTEANGQVTAHGLAPGPHAVTAWLPPRAGQPARLGTGTATVVAGDLAELTIALAPLAP